MQGTIDRGNARVTQRATTPGDRQEYPSLGRARAGLGAGGSPTLAAAAGAPADGVPAPPCQCPAFALDVRPRPLVGERTLWPDAFADPVADTVGLSDVAAAGLRLRVNQSSAAAAVDHFAEARGACVSKGDNGLTVTCMSKMLRNGFGLAIRAGQGSSFFSGRRENRRRQLPVPQAGGLVVRGHRGSCKMVAK